MNSENSKNTIQAVVLAAGKSSRFKTTTSKLVTPLCGKPLITHQLAAIASHNIPVTLVLGYQADEVLAAAKSVPHIDVSAIMQLEQKGTGHAVAISKPAWKAETLLVTYGDCPLITPGAIGELIQNHQASGAAITIVTTDVFNPTGFGRIISENGQIRVVEEKDATPDQRSITLVNAGLYLFERAFLEEALENITPSPVTGEYYLPEVLPYAYKKGLKVHSMLLPFDSVRGANTLEELWQVEQIMRARIISHHMKNGVRFVLAQTNHIDAEVEIGPDSVIHAGAVIRGKTHIGTGCTISPHVVIDDSRLGNKVTVHAHSVLSDTTVAANAQVGPFARLCNNAIIGESSVVGNFVEVKNSSLGSNTKAKHHSYLGDASIGNSVNIGAGTITCNYDGFEKHTTVIDDNAFIGSNNSLVAPVHIGAGAFTAAGSTITKDVESNDLAIGRARQVNKAGYAHCLRTAAEQVNEKTIALVGDEALLTTDKEKVPQIA